MPVVCRNRLTFVFLFSVLWLAPLYAANVQAAAFNKRGCPSGEEKIRLANTDFQGALLQVARQFEYLIAIHENVQQPHYHPPLAQCRSLHEWLTLLLDGSGFSYRLLKDTILIVPADSGTAASASQAGSYMEEIIVSGEAPSYIYQRRPGIISGDAGFTMNPDTLRRSGMYQLSNALELASGVKVEDNRYAIIRGMTGRYQSIRLNGGELPGLDPNGQSFPLDFIPLGIVNSIDLHKSVYADAPGSASAGVVSLNTVQLPDNDYVRLSASVINRPGANYAEVLQGHQGTSDHYGFDDGSRDIPAELRLSAGNGGLNTLTAAQRKASAEAAVGDMGLYKSNSYHSSDLSFTTGLAGGDNIRTGGTLTLNLRDRWQQSFIDSTVYSTGVGYSGSSASFHHEDSEHQRSEPTLDLNALATLGTELNRNHYLGFNTLFLHQATSHGELIRTQAKNEDNLPVDSAYQRNLVTWTERQLKQYQLYGNHHITPSTHLNWQISAYKNSYNSPHKLDYRYFSLASDAGFSLQTKPGTNDISWQRMDQHTFNTGIHFDHLYSLSLRETHFTGTIKFGTESSIKKRTGYLLNYWFEDIGNIADDSQLMQQRNPSDIFTPDRIIGDNNSNGFLLMENMSSGDTGLSGRFYQARQYNGAAYLLNDFDLSPNWRFIAGLRRERNTIRADLWEQQTEPLYTLENTTRWLPSFSLEHRYRSDSIRFNYSQTIVWPGINELLPVVYQDLDTRAQTIGNPELKSSDVHNLDISWQWQPADDLRLYSGVFMKRIRHPIEGIFVDNNKENNQATHSNYTFHNADFAAVRGIEMEADYSLNLADEHRLNILGRYAGIRSITKNDDETRTLQGQPRYISAIRLQYNLYSQHAFNLMYKRSGTQLYITSNSTDLPPVYQQPRHELDISYSASIRDTRISLAVNNVLNTEHQYTQGVYDYLRYYSGRVWRLSMDVLL